MKLFDTHTHLLDEQFDEERNELIPALPESIPTTRASATALTNSSKVGCEERWSEMATSPIPMTLSTTMRSFMTSPVMVLKGNRYDPV